MGMFLIMGSVVSAVLVGGVLIGFGGGVNLGVATMLLWDLVPVVLAALAGFGVRSLKWAGTAKRAALLAFGVVVLGITVWEYLDFAYFAMSTGRMSSTSALAFVFYPVVGIVPALAAALLVLPIACFVMRRAPR